MDLNLTQRYYILLIRISWLTILKWYFSILNGWHDSSVVSNKNQGEWIRYSFLHGDSITLTGDQSLKLVVI